MDVGAPPVSSVPAARRAPRFSLAILVLASLLAAAVVVQLFFVGMSIFVNGLYWWPHQALGRAFIPASIVLLAIAMAGRQPPRMRRLAAGLVVLVLIQTALAAVRGIAGALHPVNAMLVFGAIMAILRQARLARRSDT